MIAVILFITYLVWVKWALNMMQRLKLAERKIADLEMGRPVTITDPPKKLRYLRQDR